MTSHNTHEAGETMLERLYELADILDNGWERDGDVENEMRDAIRELIALRAKPAIAAFDPVWLGMLYTAADNATPVYRGVIRRAYEYISGGGQRTPTPATAGEATPVAVPTAKGDCPTCAAHGKPHFGWCGWKYPDRESDASDDEPEATAGEVVVVPASKLLAMRDAFVKGDHAEAYHVLYSIASPNFDKLHPEVWTEIESAALRTPSRESEVGAQRYALDKERCGLVKDATGNWVQITDYWTACDERDRLALASNGSAKGGA